jgi:hypothetical protein
LHYTLSVEIDVWATSVSANGDFAVARPCVVYCLITVKRYLNDRNSTPSAYIGTKVNFTVQSGRDIVKTITIIDSPCQTIDECFHLAQPVVQLTVAIRLSGVVGKLLTDTGSASDFAAIAGSVTA